MRSRIPLRTLACILEESTSACAPVQGGDNSRPTRAERGDKAASGELSMTYSGARTRSRWILECRASEKMLFRGGMHHGGLRIRVSRLVKA